MQKIFVIEDDENIRNLVKIAMEGYGYQVAAFETAEEALEELEKEKPDLAVFDLMLPGMDGLAAIRLIRERPDNLKNIPIIVLTAKDKEYDKVVGLDGGADDYMTKPFSVSELLARIEALCRRVNRGAAEAPVPDETRMVSGQFILDQKSRVLYKAGKPIDLTQVEFQIMELFFQNPGTALVREKILEGVWGENYYGDVKIVDVNIRRLRMKVEDEPSNPQHILTVWGYGYRWNG